MPCRPNCKWCAQGECWSSGQIEKPAGAAPPVKKTQTKKAKAKAQPKMTAFAAKGGAKGGAGQQNLVPMMMQMMQSMGMGKKAVAEFQSKVGSIQGVGAAAAPRQGDNSKQLLNEFVTKETGERSTKDSIVYNTTEVDGVTPTQYVSAVVLALIDPNKTYEGKPCKSKKEAEASAAAAALKENGQKTGKSQASKKAKAQPQQKKKKKAADGEAKQGGCRRKNCKWCTLGECYQAGQAEKPADA